MRVTRADAEAIAQELTKTPQIRGVELFGSVLRNGYGHDADLIILVDTGIARRWWSEYAAELRVRMGTKFQPLRRFIKKYGWFVDEMTSRARKERRVSAAGVAVGVDFAALSDRQKSGMVLDVFLMPENWRMGTELNLPALEGVIDLLHHEKTKSFLESIAQLAIRVA